MTLRPDMTTKQRLKQRPWEHAIAVILLITAITTVLTGGGVVASHLHMLVAVPWIVANLAGGVLVLLGLHWRGTTVMARALEQVGWFTEAVTLTAVCVALIYFGGWAVVPGVLEELVFVAAMLLRGWFLHDEKRAERVAINLLRKRKEVDSE